MNINYIHAFSRFLMCAFAVSILALASPGIAETDVALESDALIVSVEAGVHRVRVEVRGSAAEEWKVLSIAYVDGRGGRVKFRVPVGTSLENVRVLTNAAPSPHGKLSYAAQTFELESEDSVTLPAYGAEVLTGAAELTSDMRAGISATEVQESDVWHLDGDRLYYYNQVRGLQVFDLSDPSSPELVGFLPFAASGERMYMLDSAHVVLLASNYWEPDNEVVIVRVDGDFPWIVSRTAVRGYIEESRLIGDRLFLATTSSDSIADTPFSYYTPSVHLIELSLEDRANAEIIAEKHYSGYLSAVQATPSAIIAAYRPSGPVMSPEGNRVVICEIDNPDAPLDPIAHFRVQGSVQDKFKLNLSGDVATVVSNEQGWTEPSGFFQRTHVETFRLTERGAADTAYAMDSMRSAEDEESHSSPPLSSPPSSPPPFPPPVRPLPPAPPVQDFPADFGAQRLDGIVLGEGESLFASRFDGDRLYVVTFLVIDPLYIVDLSDPANLKVLGELEIPGYSTYLEPMGDRMLAVGVENRRVTAMLFDVGDPANPTELARVYLGEDSGSTWSEADYDERAVQVVREHGLILAPYEGFDSDSSGYVSKMQLISFSRNGLEKGGTIAHVGKARRATALDATHLVSVSSRDLHIVDASDRSEPEVIASLTLAWNTDQVFVFGDYLVHLDRGSSWYQSRSDGARVVVTTRTKPADPLATIDLGTQRVIAALQQGNFLHLARTDAPDYFARCGTISVLVLSGEVDTALLEDDTHETPEDPGSRFSLQTIDLSNPLQPTITGEHEEHFAGRHFASASGWALPGDRMVWTFYPRRYDHRGIAFPEDADEAEIPAGPTMRLMTFENAGSATPDLSYAGDVSGQLWNDEQEIVVGETLYLSRSQDVYVQRSKTSDSGFVWYPTEYLGTEYWLRAIEFDDVSAPSVGDEHSIPGMLEHVQAIPGEDSVLLFTGTHKNMFSSGSYSYRFNLDVSLFDGHEAYLIDGLEFDDRIRQRTYQGDTLAISLDSNPVGNSGRSVNIWSYRLDDGFTHQSMVQIDGSLNVLHGDRGRFFGFGSRRLHLLQTGESGGWEMSQFSLPSGFKGTGDPNYIANAAVLDDALVLPLGEYGVVSIDLNEPDGETSREAPSQFASLSADAQSTEWLQVSGSALSLGFASETGDIGALQKRSWIYRSNDYVRIDTAAEDLGDGWSASAWLGRFQDLTYPWLKHDEHGWLFSVPSSDNSAFLWDSWLDWIWTSSHFYPYFYVYGENSWIYYYPGTGSGGVRWIYQFSGAHQGWRSDYGA